MQKNKPLHILYTGGYDSTYRLLEALIIEKRTVQPHYIIDHRRHSKKIELKTMQKVMDLVREKFPHTKELLLEPIFTKRKDIPKSESHRKKVASLRTRIRLGEQYFWLVEYALLHPKLKLEISIENDEVPGNGITSICTGNTSGKGSECRIVENPDPKELCVFKDFRFPILDKTKKEMLSIAKANNFADILLNFWTCHRPSVLGNPCGLCKPCQQSIENGFTNKFNKAALKRYERKTRNEKS